MMDLRYSFRPDPTNIYLGPGPAPVMHYLSGWYDADLLMLYAATGVGVNGTTNKAAIYYWHRDIPWTFDSEVDYPAGTDIELRFGLSNHDPTLAFATYTYAVLTTAATWSLMVDSALAVTPVPMHVRCRLGDNTPDTLNWLRRYLPDGSYTTIPYTTGPSGRTVTSIDRVDGYAVGNMVRDAAGRYYTARQELGDIRSHVRVDPARTVAFNEVHNYKVANDPGGSAKPLLMVNPTAPVACQVGASNCRCGVVPHTWSVVPSDGAQVEKLFAGRSDLCNVAEDPAAHRALGVKWSGGAVSVVLFDGDHETVIQVAADCAADPPGYTPCPIVFPLADSRWGVGLFNGTSYREWQADDAEGRSWTETSQDTGFAFGEEVAADLRDVCWFRSKSGLELAAGFRVSTGETCILVSSGQRPAEWTLVWHHGGSGYAHYGGGYFREDEEGYFMLGVFSDWGGHPVERATADPRVW